MKNSKNESSEESGGRSGPSSSYGHSKNIKLIEEKAFYQFFDSLPEIVVLIDLKGNIFHANKFFRSRHVPISKRSDGQNIFHYYPKTIVPRLKKAIRQVRKEKQTGQLTIPLAEQVQHITIYPVIDLKGNVEKLLIIGGDLGKKMATELDLVIEKFKYQNLINNLHEGIWVIDNENNTVFVNTRLREMLGFSTDELQERDIFYFLDPKYVASLKHYLGRQKRNSLGFQEFVFRSKTGKPVTILLGSTPIFNDNGVYNGVVLHLLDISQARALEQDLRISEGRYQSLAKIYPIGVFHTDREGNLKYVNRRWSEITGLPAREALGQGWTRAIHPDDRQKVVEKWQKAIKKKQSFKAEFRFLHLDEKITWAVVRASAERDESGEVVGFVGTLIDVTEQKQVEVSLHRSRKNLIKILELRNTQLKQRDEQIKREVEERLRSEFKLQESEARYQNLINILPDAIVVYLMEDGKIVLVNQTLVSLLKADSPDAFLGKSVRDFVPKRYQGIFEKIFRKLLDKADQTPIMEAKLRDLQGGIVNVELTAARITMEEKPAILFVIRDITERKQAQRKIREQNRFLKNILNSISDPFIVIDVKSYHVQIANSAARNLYPYRPNIYCYSLLHRLNDPCSGNLHPCPLKQVVETRDAITVEHIHYVQGKKRVFEIHGYPILNDAGEVSHMIEYTRDITVQRMAEESLQISEQRLKKAQQIARLGNWDWDIRHNKIYWSEEVYRIFGLEPKDFPASFETFLNTVHPDDREHVKNAVNEALAGLKPYSIDHRIVLPDGRIRIVHEEAEVTFDKNRKPVRMVGTTQDITEFKQTEEKLRKLSSVVEQSAEVVMITDREGRIEYVNPAFEMVTGYSWEEVLGKKPNILKSGVYDDAFYRKMWETITSGKVFYADMKNRKKNGEIYIEQKIVSALRDSKGNITSFVSTGKDVTKQKHFEEEKKKVEEKYRQFFMEDLSGDYIATADGKLLMCNPAFARILGYDSIEEVMKVNFHKFYPDRQQLKEFYDLLKREKKLVNHEMELLDRNGNRLFVIQNVRAHFDKKGNIREVQGYIIDITERKKLEQQFFQAQKMEAIGKLAGGVAHDFNNILTVIQGYSDLLLTKIPEHEPFYREILQIKKAGLRASQLTHQLLAFSRRQVIQPKVVNLNDLIHEIQKMLRRLIGEDIKLVVHLDPHLGNVKIDPGQFDQIMMNLAVNARDAMPNGGVLTIETKNMIMDEAYVKSHPIVQSGEYVMLAISDTGVGMEKDVISHIFEPFFTTKERGKGTGLGLSTVYGIVKQNNGYIWVYSEPGKGTTFKIYFPLVKQKQDQDETDYAPVQSFYGRETVLLVEDDYGVRELAESVLTEYGYHALVAESPAEAIELAKKHSGEIDFLLTDVIMPGMTGKDLAEKIIKTNPKMKILYMSGYTDNAIVQHRVLNKKVEFIQKPFTPLALLKKIRQMIDNP